MPSVTLHPPHRCPAIPTSGIISHPPNPLPSLLRTPLGLAIIEIQGSLNIGTSASSNSEDDHATDDARTALNAVAEYSEAQISQGQMRLIGRITFPLLRGADTAIGTKEGPWMKKAHLYVGNNQRLVGEVRGLGRAMAVVKRKGANDRPGAGEEAGVASTEELEIVDLVRWKVFFGGRPEFI